MFECSFVFKYLLGKERKKGYLWLGTNFIYKVGENELFLNYAIKKLEGPMEDISHCYNKVEFQPLNN